MNSFLSKSPSETTALAIDFASSLRRNEVVTLIGELGSGKTQFVKGVCQYFRVQNSVSSPTFVMLHRYAGTDGMDEELLIYHFDLYKVKVASEILELGYEEFFNGNGICLIEWADKLRELTPHIRTEIRFSLGAAENERHIEVERYSTERTTNVPDSQFARNVHSELARN
jgi:tRNA threonylcarbamoyladenosine biosynthesis protein TsaE